MTTPQELASTALRISAELETLSEDIMIIACAETEISEGNFDCEEWKNIVITDSDGIEVYPNGAGEISCGTYQITNTYQDINGLSVNGNGLNIPLRFEYGSIVLESGSGVEWQSQSGNINTLQMIVPSYDSDLITEGTFYGGQDADNDRCELTIPMGICEEKEGFPTAISAPFVEGQFAAQTFPGTSTTWLVGDGTDSVDVARVTDNVNINNSHINHTYSKISAFNADNTLLAVYDHVNGTVYTVDLTNPTFPQTVIPLSSNFSFSAVDPNIIIGVSGTDLGSYNVSTNGPFIPYGISANSIGKSEGRQSYNDQYIAIDIGSNIEVWDLFSNTLLSTIAQPASYNWSGVSSNGNYVVVTQNDTSSGGLQTFQIYDAATGNLNYTHLPTTGVNQHADVGLDCNGDEILVSVGEGEPYWVHLATGEVFKWDFTNNATDPRMLTGWVSGIASIERPGYFYFSSGLFALSPEPAAYLDLFAAQACPTTNSTSFDRDSGYTGTNGVFEALSNDIEWWGSSSISPGNTSYWYQPKAAVSADGTHIVTTSGVDDFVVSCENAS